MFTLSLLAAQDDALDDLFSIFEEQDRIGTVATASGRAVALREAPGSNWILDRAALSRTPAIDLYDVLRTLPGMVPRELSLNHQEANMRFVSSVPDFNTLVVVDGRSVTADASGSFFDRKSITLRDVERVELVNGPASTLYGPNALLGVISVQRKKPRLTGTQLTFAGDVGFATGTPTSSSGPLQLLPLANVYANLDQGWGSGGVRLTATGTYLPSFGYQNDSGVILMEPGRKVAGTIDVRQRVRGFELRVQADAMAKRSLYELGDGGVTDQQDYALNVLLEKEKLLGRDDRLLLNAWVRHFRVILRPELAGIRLDPLGINATAMELRGVYALATFHGNSLTVGAQTRLSLTDSTFPIGSRAQWLLGLFAEDTYRPLEQLVLTAGVRVDVTHRVGEGSGATASPRASVAWLINERHSLRVDYATAFQTPQVLERTGQVLAQDGSPFIIGNPAMKNMAIHNFSLAWLGRIGMLNARLEAFIAYTQDVIAPHFEPWGSDTFETPDGRPLYRAPGGGRYKYPFYFDNRGNYWIPGAVARVDLTPRSWLRFFGNYTFVPVDQMHYVGVGGELERGGFLLSAQAYFHDQEVEDPGRTVNLPGRFFMNARAAYTLDAKGRFTLALVAMNLFDVRFRYRGVPGKPLYYGDASTGERLGPRVFLTLELRPFGS